MQKILQRSQSEIETVTASTETQKPEQGSSHSPEGGWSDALGSFADNPSQTRQGGETIFMKDGRSFVIGRVEQAIKAQYEELLIKKAKYWVNRTRMEEGPAAYQEELSALVADRGMGGYQWDGRYGRRSREDFPGLIMLLYLLLRRSYGNQATEELAREIMEDNAKEVLLALSWAQGNSSGSSANGGTEKTSHKNTMTMDS